MRFLLPVLFAVAALGLLAFQRTSPGAPSFLLGGIQVNEPDHGAWIEALDDHGMNTVEVTVYAHQGDWDSANLWFDEEEPWVVAEIRAAKARGLAAVLVLRVALDHAFERNKFLWHGQIQPRTEEELTEWFARYGRFAERWAAIAEREGVDVLAVASELNALTNTIAVDDVPALEEYWTNPEKVRLENGRLLGHAASGAPGQFPVRGFSDYASLESYLDDRAAAHAAWATQTSRLGAADPVGRINHRRELLDRHWRDLIDRVRRSYRGELTYAANFDQVEFVAFWDALDQIGVNAYYPLRRSELPGLAGADLEAQLRAGWRRVLGSLDALRRARGLDRHRVLFTEIGYVPRANATLEPWASDGVAIHRSGRGERLFIWREEPADSEERALALRALYEVHLEQGADLLSGLLYWKLSTVPSHRNVEPFVVLLGPDAPADPLAEALTRFTRDLPRDLRRRQLLRLLDLQSPRAGRLVRLLTSLQA